MVVLLIIGIEGERFPEVAVFGRKDRKEVERFARRVRSARGHAAEAASIDGKPARATEGDEV
jgi:hypothetical protein